MSNATTDNLFLRAARNEPTDRRPVWMMRQAGRYLPEYRELRADNDFLTLCKTPELATEVTLQPIRRYGMDAAILFADILLPLEAMGAELRFVKGDGPQFPRPVRSVADLGRLKRPDVEATLGYVFEALRRVRRELDPATALLGFAGTPWTLAAYLVEGGVSKQFHHLLAWSYADPSGLTLLLDRIAEVTCDYLEAQVDAGAEAIQLFDTWGGLLDAERWRRIARPSVERILQRLGERVPTIFYLREGAHLQSELATLPVNVLSVDWRQPLDVVRAAIGPSKVLQGNLDPGALLGPVDEIETRTREMLRRGLGGGHIANLGHGIFKETPLDHAGAFIRTVQSTQLADLDPL